MCGIAGEVRFDGREADVVAVARINQAMHRRGPDGSGDGSDGATDGSDVVGAGH